VNLGAIYCGKDCRVAVTNRKKREDYEANRATRLEEDREYLQAHPGRGVLTAARRRAGRLGIAFELEGADIPRSLGDSVVCGRELEMGTRKVTASSPTIDRIRPELGYVEGNVLAWVCFSCNARKHSKTLCDLADGAAGEHWHAWAVAHLAQE
jgi:hypothetical protein